MNKLNVAVIGAGSMGKNHARIYAEMDEVELVSVCDASKDIGDNLAERYHVKYFEDYREMLKKLPVDMVSIAVPTHLHYEVAKDCINAGVSVLIEKPIAAEVNEAQDLIDLAKKKGVVLTVGHTERFNPAIIELKRRLERGEIGKIYKISASRLSPFPLRIVDMGVVIDLAVHDLDIFSYLLESEVTSVQAVVQRRLHKQHEDVCVAILRYENGVLGVLNLDRITPMPVRELKVTGEKGMLEVNYLLQDLYLYRNGAVDENAYEYSQHIMGVTPGDIIKVQINKREPLRVELEAFEKAVRTKKTPGVTGEEALRALRLAHQVLEAGRLK